MRKLMHEVIVNIGLRPHQFLQGRKWFIDLIKSRVTWVEHVEAHSQGEIILKTEHWSHARYAACAVRVTIFSTGGEFKFCPVSNFM